MYNLSVFDGIEENDIKKLLNNFNSFTLHYKKDSTILSNVSRTSSLYIILNGQANVVRYNFNGTKTIIQRMDTGDIFGYFSASPNDDVYVISSSECDVLLFEYEKLINRTGRNIEAHNKLVDNIVTQLGLKLQSYNERIEILTEKTIRDKLLKYFNSLSKKQLTKSLYVPFTLSDLSDYLAIDRSAMMREIRNLNDDGLIESKGRYINIKY